MALLAPEEEHVREPASATVPDWLARQFRLEMAPMVRAHRVERRRQLRPARRLSSSAWSLTRGPPLSSLEDLPGPSRVLHHARKTNQRRRGALPTTRGTLVIKDRGTRPPCITDRYSADSVRAQPVRQCAKAALRQSVMTAAPHSSSPWAIAALDLDGGGSVRRSSRILEPRFVQLVVVRSRNRGRRRGFRASMAIL